MSEIEVVREHGVHGAFDLNFAPSLIAQQEDKDKEPLR